MANMTMADLDVTPANIHDVLGQSTLGTAAANTLDDIDRATLALLAREWGDLGGLATVGGGANAITLTSLSTYGSLETGITMAFKAGADNTSAVTLNLDGQGSKAVMLNGGTALSGGEIITNGIYIVKYDQAYNGASGGWMLLNPALATPAKATAADWRTGTDVTKLLGVKLTWDAAASVGLTDATTIVVDMSTFINAHVTLGGNRTMGQPSNIIEGKTGRFRIKQDATGSRTLSWHADYEFASGSAPTLSTAANAEDVLYFDQLASGRTLITGPVRAVA